MDLSKSSSQHQQQQQQQQQPQQQQQQQQQQPPVEDKAGEQKPPVDEEAASSISSNQGRRTRTEVNVDSLGPCMGLSIMHFLRNNPTVDLEDSAGMRRLGEAAVRGLLGLRPRED